MSLTTVNKLINDIEMDHCASSNDSLATTGIGPCIGFVILLNDCHHVFIEHRSSVYLPSTFDLNNVRSVLKSVVQHVSKTLPGSNKEEKELNYLVTVINHFCSSTTDLGAVERLLSDVKAMLGKTTIDLERQINLDDFDE
ncbi:unnamed protein product [Rotaria magnacalcarata]|uniref:Uncharacterized protein n=1 Tax=Rotaria magnacalcarata TaxID=392030 RepID=A0A818YA61_9BILA|nr:unnamed protein product [Rotaria magnacalcarata]CAF3751923.1 unnamed protein product [Rotaria magnacalcarata]